MSEPTTPASTAEDAAEVGLMFKARSVPRPDGTWNVVMVYAVFIGKDVDEPQQRTATGFPSKAAALEHSRSVYAEMMRNLELHLQEWGAANGVRVGTMRRLTGVPGGLA